MTPISAVLIAQNEERKIRAALESVRFCDEMVVVDSGSTDRTREIAEKAGARVIVNAPWPGFVAQRNFAVRAARHDWILALDADERVSPALRAGDRGPAHAGLRLPRLPDPARGPSTSAAGSAPPTGIPTRRSGSSTARAGAGKARSSTSRCACAARWARSGASWSTTPTPTSATTCARSTSTRPSGPGRRSRPDAARAPGEMAASSLLGLPPELRAEGRLPPRPRRSHGLDPELLLHVREAGEARGAGPRASGKAGMKVLHVDTAAGWRGGQNQVLLTARGQAARGHEVTVACRAGGALEARARAAPPSSAAPSPSAATSGRPRSWASPAPCAGSGPTSSSSTTPTRSRPGCLAARLAAPAASSPPGGSTSPSAARSRGASTAAATA